MPKDKLIPIKKAELSNNCPECYNSNLTLTFYQKLKERPLYSKMSGEIINEISCNVCNSKIYPITWSQDIERVVKYYEKMVVPKKDTVKFTSLFYLVLLTAIAIIIASIAYLRYAEII